jgi:tetratricopeptide (TPR) repeat protein
MDQADASESDKPAVRGAGSRQSRQVVVTRAVTSSPLDAAYAAMTAGRLDEAATAYRKALATNPGERDAFLGLAYIAQRKGNNDEARELFLQVLRIDPANSGANSGLLAIAAEGDLPQAASRAREMAERAPDSAVVMGTLGGILAKEGRIAEAQQAYFRAVTLEPDNAFHAFNLAVALDRLHKNSQALSFYQRALALAERSTEADRSGFPFKEARQRVEQLSQPANVPLAPSRTDSQAR